MTEPHSQLPYIRPLSAPPSLSLYQRLCLLCNLVILFLFTCLFIAHFAAHKIYATPSLYPFPSTLILYLIRFYFAPFLLLFLLPPLRNLQSALGGATRMFGMDLKFPFSFPKRFIHFLSQPRNGTLCLYVCMCVCVYCTLLCVSFSLVSLLHLRLGIVH